MWWEVKARCTFNKIHSKNVLKNVSIHVSTHHRSSSGERRGKPLHEVAKRRGTEVMAVKKNGTSWRKSIGVSIIKGKEGYN